jgi:hypothetical protein
VPAVRIHGLVSKKELNGTFGVALSHDAGSGRYLVRSEGTAGVTLALRPSNLTAEAAVPTRTDEMKPVYNIYNNVVAFDVAPKKSDSAPVDVSEAAAPMASAAAAAPASADGAVSQHDTTLESPERTAAYAKAAAWKKPAEPGSVEAFFKNKNKTKREDDEAKLAAWKAANPHIAAQLDANKHRARKTVGYALGAQAPKLMNELADGDDAPPAPKPAQAKAPPKPAVDRDSPEIAAALAALKQAPQPKPTARATPGAADDLLASVLGSLGTPPVAAARAPPASGKPRQAAAPVPTDAEDLLAAALAKSGAAATPNPAAGGGYAALAAPRSAALDAYKRRQTFETDDAEGDVGTVSAELQRQRERVSAARAEAKYRDKHAFVGEHYNDI